MPIWFKWKVKIILPDRQKMKTSRHWLRQMQEDRLDYELGIRALQENGPIYSLDEVMQRSGMDKYYLKFRTQRLQKKHRLKIDATQK